MHVSRILVPVVMVAASSMALAHPADKDRALSFSTLDKDQNGQLTKAELPSTTMYSKHFTKIDADGDGMLSEAEVRAHLIAMGMSPDEMKSMDHGDMKGMNHDDATKSDRDDMDDGDY